MLQAARGLHGACIVYDGKIVHASLDIEFDDDNGGVVVVGWSVVW